MVRTGFTIINSDLVLKAYKRKNTQMWEEKKENERKGKIVALNKQEVAVYFYGNWVMDGRQEQNIKMGKKEVTAIAKALMPRLAPKKKVSVYTSATNKIEEVRNDYSRGTVVIYKHMSWFEHCFDPLKDYSWIVHQLDTVCLGSTNIFFPIFMFYA